MLMLSRLILNPLSRHVQRDLTGIVELHRTVMRAFPEVEQPARKSHGVLFRLEVNERRGLVVLVVQSNAVPQWENLPPGYLLESDEPNALVKPFEALDSLASGRELTFRLRANPTKRVTAKDKSQRVELRGDEARLAWLRRKADNGGFALCAGDSESDLLIREENKTGGRHQHGDGRGSGRITLRPVLFEGRLRIVDAEQFKRTIREGIGPAKAYGCGLLSVAP